MSGAIQEHVGADADAEGKAKDYSVLGKTVRFTARPAVVVRDRADKLTSSGTTVPLPLAISP